MRVIVCGGRNYGEVPNVTPSLSPQELTKESERASREREKLIRVLRSYDISDLAQGGASGADGYAEAWADLMGVPCKTYKAKWRLHGKGAGPIRNQQMLDEFKPDAVIAFPGGKGTADMVRRAKASGVRVIEVEP